MMLPVALRVVRGVARAAAASAARGAPAVGASAGARAAWPLGAALSTAAPGDGAAAIPPALAKLYDGSYRSAEEAAAGAAAVPDAVARTTAAEVAAAGALAALSRAVLVHGRDSAEVVTAAFRGMEAIMSQLDDDAVGAAASTSGLPLAAATALAAHPADAAVAFTVLDALGSAARDDQTASATIVNAGLLPLVVKAMDTHRASAAVARAGACVLCAVAQAQAQASSSPAAAALAAVPAVETVIGAMRRHPKADRLTKYALMVVYRQAQAAGGDAARLQAVKDAGAEAAAQDAAAAFPNDDTVQELRSRVLKQLGVKDPSEPAARVSADESAGGVAGGGVRGGGGAASEAGWAVSSLTAALAVKRSYVAAAEKMVQQIGELGGMPFGMELVEAGAADALVAGMRAHPDDSHVAKLSAAVLGRVVVDATDPDDEAGTIARMNVLAARFGRAGVGAAFAAALRAHGPADESFVCMTLPVLGLAAAADGGATVRAERVAETLKDILARLPKDGEAHALVSNFVEYLS
jgi:hypothetical protein